MGLEKLEDHDQPIGQMAEKALFPVDAFAPDDFITCSALADEDRHAAYRLRYDVYIAEQRKNYSEADHEKKFLTDDLDEDGDVIVVQTRDGCTVGTVRANWFDSEVTFERYAHLFDIEKFQSIDRRLVAVCSRLAASTEHRHAYVRELLFETIYRHGMDRGTVLCFATCAPILRRMFRKYGFREFAVPILDPVVGPLHRMLLVIDDLTHLEHVGSPFLSIAVTNGIGAKKRPWLRQIFHGYEFAMAK